MGANDSSRRKRRRDGGFFYLLFYHCAGEAEGAGRQAGTSM
jgi:hypothetical protein